MKKKEFVPPPSQSLQKLSLSVGNFIRYWGFRRIHGAIWTQLYLSKTPLNCTELAKRLGLSKALVSPALEELCEYRLISEGPAPNEKAKVYQAKSDVNEVIRHVLKTRESKMLKQISKDFASFQKTKTAHEEVDPTRVHSLGEMILAANLMLEIMLSQDDLMSLPKEFEA